MDQYHLIKLMPVSSQPSFQQQASVSTPSESPPKSFLAIQNLIELDPDEICFEHLKSVLCMFNVHVCMNLMRVAWPGLYFCPCVSMLVTLSLSHVLEFIHTYIYTHICVHSLTGSLIFPQ